MQLLSVNEFRNQIGEYINQVYYANKAFTLIKGSKPEAALVPPSLLERLATLEEFYQKTLANQPPDESTEQQTALATAKSEPAWALAQTTEK